MVFFLQVNELLTFICYISASMCLQYFKNISKDCMDMLGVCNYWPSYQVLYMKRGLASKIDCLQTTHQCFTINLPVKCEHQKTKSEPAKVDSQADFDK